jgi:hypothetical protein
MSSLMITFNVGGKLYTTTLVTLELMVSRTNGDDLLNMLVRQSGDNNDVIFIDRDHKLFRWILYAYREGVILKHSDIGVPKSVWDGEINFYGIKPMPPSPKKVKVHHHHTSSQQNEIEQELISNYKEHVEDRRQAKKQNTKKAKEEYNSRKPMYLNLLRYLCNSSSGSIMVVKTGEGKNGPYIPSSARTINGIEYDPLWLKNNFKEFQEYATSLGYYLDLNINMEDNSINYVNDPASSYNTQYTRHHKISATVRIFFKKLTEADLQLSETSETE